MAAKWTKGPWEHLPGDSECAHPRVVARIVRDRPYSICVADVGNAESVKDAGEEWEANAALIAEAPNLVEALRLCQQTLALLTAAKHTSTNDPAVSVVNAWAQCVEAEASARAALARAEGQG